MKKFGFAFATMFAIMAFCAVTTWARSSAISNAGANSEATAIGITNNNPTANAVANSQSGVNFNSNPSASAVGIGGQGGTASAQGGTTSSRVNNDVGVNPTITGSNSVNAGQTVSPSTQSSVKIDSHAVTKNKYVNRQFPQAGIPGAPGTMQYFGQLKNQPWNVFPPVYGKWIGIMGTEDIPYKKLWVHLYQSFSKTKTVNFVRYGTVREGKLVASVAVMLSPTQGTDDAQAIVNAIAMKNGGNYIEILSSSAVEMPTSKGWHIGSGAGASGVIGADEKVGISGAGGTGYGKSSLMMEFCPFMQVRIWRDGQSLVNKSSNSQKIGGQQSVSGSGERWHTIK